MAIKKYPQELRDSTVQLALNSDDSVLKIGKDLGINPKTIYNWIREYKSTNNTCDTFHNEEWVLK